MQSVPSVSDFFRRAIRNHFQISRSFRFFHDRGFPVLTDLLHLRVVLVSSVPPRADPRACCSSMSDLPCFDRCRTDSWADPHPPAWCSRPSRRRIWFDPLEDTLSSDVMTSWYCPDTALSPGFLISVANISFSLIAQYVSLVVQAGGDPFGCSSRKILISEEEGLHVRFGEICLLKIKI